MSGLEILAPIVKGYAKRNAAYANANQSDLNADIEDQNTKLAVRQQQLDAEDKRRSNRRALSGIRAAYGASGFTMDGSPMDVLEDTSVEQELDSTRIDYQARERRRSGTLSILGHKGDARSYRSQGKAAVVQGYIEGGQKAVEMAEKAAKAASGGG